MIVEDCSLVRAKVTLALNAVVFLRIGQKFFRSREFEKRIAFLAVQPLRAQFYEALVFATDANI